MLTREARAALEVASQTVATLTISVQPGHMARLMRIWPTRGLPIVSCALMMNIWPSRCDTSAAIQVAAIQAMRKSLRYERCDTSALRDSLAGNDDAGRAHLPEAQRERALVRSVPGDEVRREARPQRAAPIG